MSMSPLDICKVEEGGASATPEEVVSEYPVEGKVDQTGIACCTLVHCACTSLERANGPVVLHALRMGAQYALLQTVLEVRQDHRIRQATPGHARTTQEAVAPGKIYAVFCRTFCWLKHHDVWWTVPLAAARGWG